MKHFLDVKLEVEACKRLFYAWLLGERWSFEKPGRGRWEWKGRLVSELEAWSDGRTGSGQLAMHVIRACDWQCSWPSKRDEKLLLSRHSFPLTVSKNATVFSFPIRSNRNTFFYFRLCFLPLSNFPLRIIDHTSVYLSEQLTFDYPRAHFCAIESKLKKWQESVKR